MTGNACKFCGEKLESSFGLCMLCGSLTPPRAPISEDANSQFTDYSYNRYETSFMAKIFLVWMKLQGWLFSSNSFLSRVANVIFSPLTGGKPNVRFSDKERFADVGCGKGFFLRELPKSWSVCGYDIVDYGIKDRDICVGNFETMDIKDCYSIVRSSHSVEHAQNPKKFIQKIIRITKNGGYIAISSPNAHSLSRRIFGKYWVPYAVESHFCIMNINALSRYLEENGCTIVYKNTYTLFSDAGSLIEALGIEHFRGIFFVLFTIVLLPLTFVEFISDKSDSFIIYALKK